LEAATKKIKNTNASGSVIDCFIIKLHGLRITTIRSWIDSL
jgi:hypothetical protein